MKVRDTLIAAVIVVIAQPTAHAIDLSCGTGREGNCSPGNAASGTDRVNGGASTSGASSSPFGALGAFDDANRAARNGTASLPACAGSPDPLAFSGNSLGHDLKDSSELEGFMGKQGFVANEGYKVYRPLIGAAAKAFAVPEQLLTCILWQESRFNPNAIGPMTKYGHAYGMGQIIEPTMREIGGVYRQGMGGSGGGAGAGASEAENSAYEEAVKRRDTLRVGWPRYFHNLQELVKAGKVRGESDRTDDEKSRREKSAGPRSDSQRQSNLLMEVPRTPPSSIEPKDAMNPVIAIAASAMYLRQLMQMMARNVGSPPADELLAQPSVAFLGVVAGAYNAGPGNAIKYLKRANPPSVDGWRNTMITNSNKETQNYVRKVSECMGKGIGAQTEKGAQ